MAVEPRSGTLEYLVLSFFRSHEGEVLSVVDIHKGAKGGLVFEVGSVVNSLRKKGHNIVTVVRGNRRYKKATRYCYLSNGEYVGRKEKTGKWQVVVTFESEELAIQVADVITKTVGIRAEIKSV